MTGRDPHQPHRVSTSLELLFDLTFVLAYGSAANQLAHALAAGHLAAGVGGFLFAIFAISWAWINFAWFASAYDTDDWVFRLTTMLQMSGVLILGLGLPAMFASLARGTVDIRVMVLGYVIMRVPMIVQWARAAHQDLAHRRSTEIRIAAIVVSQIGWCLLLRLPPRIGLVFGLAAIPLAAEVYAPIVAERRYGGMPWHAHHIAERYGCVVLIALGEGLVGTLATLAAVVGPQGPGWSLEVALVGLAGTAMTFGMWWIYFVIPSGPLLAAHRDRGFGWGYGHIVLFAATVAVGAGLHVAAFTIEHHSALSVPATLLCTAIPLGLFLASVFALSWALSRSASRGDGWMLLGAFATIAAALALAVAGVSLAASLIVLALAPWVAVVGYEAFGHRHSAEVLRGATEV
ncbi:MAG: low temperature requirement protein A [Deltaproteobacteria bacterium]|nr:low temperature requirement protein A [Deltaproteobacteria bacterium]MCW5801369.1 low temperature requirement protein A [Deltaproteobacteria bacterium]